MTKSNIGEQLINQPRSNRNNQTRSIVCLFAVCEEYKRINIGTNIYFFFSAMHLPILLRKKKRKEEKQTKVR